MVLNLSLNICNQGENSCEEIICLLGHFYNFSYLMLSNALSEPGHQPRQHWELVFPQTKGSFLITEVSHSHRFCKLSGSQINQGSQTKGTTGKKGCDAGTGFTDTRKFETTDLYAVLH